MIATAVTVPLLVVAAVLIVSLSNSGSGSSGPLPPLTASAPPHADAQRANCTKVLEKLPVKLNGLQARTVHTRPDSPFVVAWGDPAIVLSCGVDRPKALHPNSSTQLFPGSNARTGPYFAVTNPDDDYVWTSVDRAPYISVTIPSKYQGSSVMPPLSRAIGAALPAVCAVSPDGNVPRSKLCTRRP